MIVILALCGAAALSTPDADVWASTLVARTAQTPAFASLTQALTAAKTAMELGAALPPLNVSLGADHGQQAVDLGDFRHANTNVYARGDIYLPFGGNFSSGLVVGWDQVARPGLDVALSVDVLRDFSGRFTRAQRNSAVASAESQYLSTRAVFENALLTMLAAGLDVCVQEDLIRRTEEVLTLVRSSLAIAEQRVKVGLARESDVLQVRGSLLSAERGLNDLGYARDALARSFRTTYGDVLDTAQCPTLAVEVNKTEAVKVAAGTEAELEAPQLASRRVSIRRAELALEAAELAIIPTLSPYVRVAGAGVLSRTDLFPSPLVTTADAWNTYAGVELTWQLGNAPGELNMRLARETVSVSKAERDQAYVTLRAELVQIATQMRGLETALEIVEKQRQTAFDVLRLQRQRYEIGSMSTFELAGAFQNYIQAQTVAPPLLAQWRKLYWRSRALVGELSRETQKGSP